MINELDIVLLTQDLPDERLTVGDVGTVVQVHQHEAGHEIELVTLSGRTVAVANVLADQVRAITPRDLAHVRELQPA